MKLKYLQLENFQGIRDGQFVFDGQDADIFGDNATGKTTVYNAFTWLLFDKPSTGAKSFTPKTRLGDDYMHNATHAVTAELITDTGAIIALRKEYKEIYTKKRGSLTEEFTGHTTDYFIDRVPAQKAEYDATVTKICGPEELVKMLTMPEYFAAAIKPEARRGVLLEICGDIPDADIIRGNEELGKLNDYLLKPGSDAEYYTVAEWRKIAAAKSTQIKKDIDSLPARIDEARRAMPDTSGLNQTAIADEITAQETALTALHIKRAEAQSGDDARNSIREQINDANAAMLAAQAKHDASEREKANKADAAIREKQKDLREAEDAIRQLKRDAEDNAAALEKAKQLREKLWEEYKAVKAETWDAGAETCPACGQALPEDKITQLREDFNERKSSRLTEINNVVKQTASRELIAALEQKATEYARALSEADAVEFLTAQLRELEAAAYQPRPYNKTEHYRQQTSKLDELRTALNNVEADTAARLAPIDAEITATQNSIKALKANLALFDISAAQAARITELTAQQKQLAKDYDNIQYGIYLCERLERLRADILTERVNDIFSPVSFRLFKQLVNGGIEPDCEVLVPDDTGNYIPYPYANHAAQVNAGLEIITVLGQHYGRQMPIFIDNAESVTRLVKIDAQVIRLIVSEADKTLRLVNNL